MITENIQRYATLADMEKLSGGDFFRMQGFVDIFFDKAPNVTILKALTVT